MHYIAFLRGVGPSIISNEKLRESFVSLGMSNVKSVISSGNILFDTDDRDIATLENSIHRTILDQHGANCPVFIRELEKLKRMIDAAPFGAQTHSPQTYQTVTLLKKKPLKTPSTDEIDSKHTRIIGFDRKLLAIYAVTDTTLAKTPDFMTKLEKIYGKQITTRTYNTIQKICK